jgi:hypothetical protein
LQKNKEKNPGYIQIVGNPGHYPPGSNMVSGRVNINEIKKPVTKSNR